MSVRMRQEIERKVIRLALQSLVDAGYFITVNNGEEDVIENRVNVDIIMREMFTTDEEELFVNLLDASVPLDGPAREPKARYKNFGWIKLVYGNDGYDVISDYTTNLERLLTDANELGDYYSEDGEYLTFADWQNNKAEAAAERTYERGC